MNKVLNFFLSLSFVLFFGCTNNNAIQLAEIDKIDNGNGFFIVDYLLPGQVRKLGEHAMYLTARRAAKIPAMECEIRGGEYVAYDRANFSTSLKIWMPKARLGDAEAQAYVGEIFEKGMGLPPDYGVAAQWYSKSAEQGNIHAQISLGYLYEKGLGVEKDNQQAMYWYKRSSGLEQENLNYAATISTSTDYEKNNEINSLKSELKKSQNLASSLSQQLSNTQKKLNIEKDDLLKSQLLLTRAEFKLKTSISNTNQDGIQNLKEVIKTQQHLMENKSKKISELETLYSKEVKDLRNKLNETQERAQQIATQYQNNKNSVTTIESQLADKQIFLSKVEKRMLDLQTSFNEQHELINLLKSEKHQFKEKIKAIQTDKIKYDGTQIELRRTRMELEKRQNKMSELEQEFQLQSEKLNNELEKKDQHAELVTKLNHEKSKLESNIFDLIKNAAATAETESQLVNKQMRLSKVEKRMYDLQTIFNKQNESINLLKSEKYQFKDKIKAFQAEGKKYNRAQIKLQQTQMELTELNQKFQLQNKKLNDELNKRQQHKKLIAKLNDEKPKLEENFFDLLNSTPATSSGNLIKSKPVIEIIEPVFVMADSMPTVKLRSVTNNKQIVGKISSSGNLLSLLVNDKEESVNKGGVFKTNLKTEKEKTPVKIIAIDELGRKSSLEFIFLKNKETRTSNLVSNISKKLDFGNYHALIIGNKNYLKIPSLDTPVNDARAIKKILKNKYGFQTNLLINGTRFQILSALNKLRGKLTGKDNLLIYYAGHGELDRVNMRGHWLPVDSDSDNTANWISTVSITDILNTMSAKHIIVVSDSCYSGAMTRSSISRLEAGLSEEKQHIWKKAMLKKASRTILSSGGLQPVMDGGGGENSVFAKAIKALKNNSGLLEGQKLYRQISSDIISTAANSGMEQVPEYAPIKHSGHEAGEFFFVPKS